MIALSLVLAAALHLEVAGTGDSARAFDNEIGLGMGWGNPFGSLALEYWHQCGPRHEIGTGAGLGTTGYTFGLGYKRYFQETVRLNPWIGLSAYYSTGCDSMFVIVPKTTMETYRIKPGFVVHPRIGLRYQAGWVNLHFGMGWGFPVMGGGVEFEEQTIGRRSNRAAEWYGIGGLELSMAAMLRI